MRAGEGQPGFLDLGCVGPSTGIVIDVPQNVRCRVGCRERSANLRSKLRRSFTIFEMYDAILLWIGSSAIKEILY